MSMTVRPVAALFSLIAWLHLHTHRAVSAQCLDDQKSLLLQLRNTLKFNHSSSTKLIWWNQSTDCCQWIGVQCDPSTGQVIGLDLSQESINGRVDNCSSLFRLRSLQSLNLAYNFGIDGEIPSAIGNLTSLTYLNLSLTGFTGQVPIELSWLVNLNVLDISDVASEYFEVYPLYMKNPNLARIIQDLTNLKELYLDGIAISAHGYDWCETISSSLPHLQVLSLANCSLTGEIHPSLLRLQSLSVIRLDQNNLDAPLPRFLGRLKNLTALRLADCQLIGKVPPQIFQVPTLRTLDLSYNDMLTGTFPDFPMNSSLETLSLSYTNISGFLPNSISNLKSLRWIDLVNCSLSGIMPSSIADLNQLEYLDISCNNFCGPLPTFSSAENLSYLNLAWNNFSGSIASTNWGSLLKLEYIHLFNNSLTGSIPMSLFSLPSLQSLNLAYNAFNGQFGEFASIPSPVLELIDLRNNFLEGPLPRSLFQLRGLTALDLSFNKFNGTLELYEFLQRFKSLSDLDLSHNSLSIDTNGIAANSSVPQLSFLELASCNLSVIPQFLRMQTNLEILDLSNNQIHGKVPGWIWEVSGGGLSSLNLSCNSFTDLELPKQSLEALSIIDLHSNKFHGEIQVVPAQGAIWVDYSDNMFTSISPEIGNYLNYTIGLYLLRNSIHGSIPTSLCNAVNLKVLDLGYNYLNGTIPSCLIPMSQSLVVLNLRGNNLTGVIPDEFSRSCSLETLDFNRNFLDGQIPTSLANCKELKVLDLGNNHLQGNFPFHLQGLSSLQVLILRSNKFHGVVACTETCPMWSSLQVADLAFNNFSGELTATFLFKWTRMMTNAHKMQSGLTYLQYSILSIKFEPVYYKDVMTVTLKGSQYVLQKILSTFTAIDLSNNAFHGELPREVGNLIALRILNLSHNSFTGNIPSTMGNLNLIESLDLSQNAFNGSIPPQLANLNFLDYLNLSFNKLSGHIPTGTQLQSFASSSYMGNPGLYGPPLTPYGRDYHSPPMVQHSPQDGSTWSFKDELEWVMRGAEVGFPVGITLFLWPLLYINRYRRWYSYHVDHLLMKVLPRQGHRRRTRRGRTTRKQRQRQ